MHIATTPIRHVILFFLLLTPLPGLAGQSHIDGQQTNAVFRLDLHLGGGWHDAEKLPDSKDDDWLCWAATAANVLAWSGWGLVAGFADADDIFRHFTANWTDDPSGSPREAWRWWFTGENRGKSGAQVRPGTGAFWKDVAFPDHQWARPKDALFVGIGQNMLRRQPLILRDLLHNGYGIALQIIRPKGEKDRDSHMITLWGYEHDQQDPFKAIIVSDSDDQKKQAAPTDELRVFPVTLENGFWWFSYRGQRWKIHAAYGLRKQALYYGN